MIQIAMLVASNIQDFRYEDIINRNANIKKLANNDQVLLLRASSGLVWSGLVSSLISRYLALIREASFAI